MNVGALTSMLGLGFVLEARGDLGRQLDSNRRKMEALKRSGDMTAESMVAGIDRMSAAWSDFGGAMQQSKIMALAGAAFLAPFMLAAHQAAKSQDALSGVRSLLVGTGMDAATAGRETTRLKSAIDDMAGGTRVGLRELESASYDLVSANLTLDEAIGALPATADLAVAGMGSMQDATLSMTKALNTFGMAWGDTVTPAEKATRIANTYAGTIAGLQTTLPNLTLAMQHAAGDAVALGAGIEETAILLGLLQTSGLEASRSGTAVAAMFRELINLSKKSKSDIGPLAGLGLADAAGNLRPIPDILGDIEQRLQGLGAVERATILTRAFGDEGSRALKLMLGQSDAMREQIELIKSSQPLQAMVEARQAGLIAQLKMMGNEFLALVDTIGGPFLPVFTEAAEAIREITAGIRAFTKEHPQLTRLFVVVGTGIGLTLGLAAAVRALTAVWTFGRALMPLWTVGINLMTGAMTGLGISVNSVLWPALALIAALGGILWLVDRIADTNILGSIWDFVFPSMPDMSAAQLAAAQPTRPELPFVGPDMMSAGQQITYDYSMTRINTKVDAKNTDAQALGRELNNRHAAATKRESQGTH